MPAARALELRNEDAAGTEEIAEAEEPLTVGAILREWLEEQGYETDVYARTIGLEPREVDAVCTNRIDPLVLSHERLAAVIRRPQRDMAIDEDDLVAALSRSFIADADWELVGGTELSVPTVAQPD